MNVLVATAENASECKTGERNFVSLILVRNADRKRRPHIPQSVLYQRCVLLP
jgi:hypothetical protein